MYQLGILPSVGGADNQPALFIDIMSVFASALADERELAEAEEHQRKQLVGDNAGTSMLDTPPEFARIGTP